MGERYNIDIFVEMVISCLQRLDGKMQGHRNLSLAEIQVLMNHKKEKSIVIMPSDKDLNSIYSLHCPRH